MSMTDKPEDRYTRSNGTTARLLTLVKQAETLANLDWGLCDMYYVFYTNRLLSTTQFRKPVY